MTATPGQRSNVASLEGRRARVPRRRAETLITDCREMLVEALTEAFPGIMDSIDDALFGLADKAGTDQLQSSYFETMRQIRLERDDLARAFASELAKEVQARVDRSRRVDGPAAPGAPDSGLSLVEDEDLEASLAVGNMARKVRSVCREELFGLDRRVAALLADPSIEDESNPLGPEAVCTAIGTACDSFESVTEVRLLVMKLFEQRFVRELETVYAELNAHLVRHGVLPDARAAAGAPRRSAASRRAEQAARDADGSSATADPGQSQRTQAHAPLGDAASVGGQAVMDIVQALVARPGATTTPSGLPFSTAPVPRTQMMAGLTALQHGDLAAGGLAIRPLAAGAIDAGTQNVVRELRDAGVVGAATRDDAVVIDVVAMLFDYVLGDEHVCAAVKAQIGRLQIPVLKVAIADHGFFARKSHPVRRYLDALSAVGLGLDERDPAAERVLAHVAQSVAGILEVFESEPGPFEQALEALEAFLEREQAEAAANAEQAARAAEDADRLLAARVRAGEEIAARMQGKPVPEPVRVFLDRYWRELLAQRVFAGDEGSGAWHEALELVDDLIWSVLPAPDDAKRHEVLDALPFLVARLKSAQRELSVPAEEAEHFMRELADVHLGVIRGVGVRPSAPLRPVQAQDAPAAPGEADPAVMREAIEGACRAVHAASQGDVARAGMGTTVVAVLARETMLTVGHVGDSRLYRLRAGKLTPVTLDHSMVQELMTKMGCTRDEAAEMTGSNLLTRAIGPDPDVAAEVRRVDTLPGDRYLLCSDGLSDLVPERTIATVLAADASMPDIAGTLVDAANAEGGRDNISVVLAFFGEDGEPVRMLGETDVGLRRSHNEDSIHVDAARGIAILADGMGGHNAGEVASQMTVEHIARVLGATVQLADDPAAPSAEGHDTMDDFASAFDVEDVEIEIGDDLSSEPSLASRDDASAWAMVDALEPGAWVEFERAGYRTRAQLTRISEQTGRMLFLDRRGLKVVDSTPEALVAEFRDGAARALDESPLLERTMSDVADHLRESMDAA